jgi:tripartite-type tricarboxylate transporter receptor subunit TctC
MPLRRRQFLHLAAGAAVLPAVSRIARAQAYPTRPVRWIIGYPPGGTQDIIARLLGQWLSERLGRPFVVENRPGASGNIATEGVVRAPPDGYSILMIGTASAINATLYDKLAFNIIRDLAPVARIMRVPNVLEVHPSLPIKTVPELIAYAKTNPGKLSYASQGIGTAPHISAELFKMMTGTDILHVPYRGAGPMLTDLIGGQVQSSFDNMPSSIEYIRAGKLRALAVTTAERSPALPDIPTVASFVPGYEASAWWGAVAPRNTPSDIIEKLNSEINAGLADAKLRAKLEELGGAVLPGSPDDFGKHIADEIEKWAKVIRAANIKPG